MNQAAGTMLSVSHATTSIVANLIRQNDWLALMVQTCLETGQDVGDPETTLAIGPRETQVSAEVCPLMDGSAHPTGAILVFHDLLHQKSATDAAADGDLNLRLSPAGLAHEVKNPLTGIKGAAELMAGMFPADPRAQQYCGVILDGVNRIASLVEQVMAVSTPQRLVNEPVNIHMVLHQALRAAGLYPTPPAGVTVTQDFDPSLPDVMGDATALERVFVNLIKNAAEAIGHAGKIRLHTRMETEFRMAAQGQRRQFMRVEISDSGPGLTDDQMGQLFTPFFTTKPLGTGLGLVLSQRIVALHGGRLWAKAGGVGVPSSTGSPPPGMTFKLTLPVIQPKATQ